MKNYRIDQFGKWEIREGDEMLVEPSKEYLGEQEKERLERETQQKAETEKRKRIAEIKQKLQNRTATLEEVEEVLEGLI